MIRPTHILAASLILAALLPAGCGSAPKQTDSRSMASHRGADARNAAAARASGGSPTRPEAMVRPAGQVMTTSVRAGVLPRGAVPYDDLTLPIVSPDGRSLATQAGASPTWPTVLAQPGALRPVATRIEIYRIDGAQPQFIAAAPAGLVLGRNADAQGFLVEAPQEDGSRWIGYVEWASGELHWLIADEHVNAFAGLGPDGRLAWCRRTVDELDFELVVRHGDDEWTMPASGASVLMPTWSGRGAGLFAFTLTDGFLDAVYGLANDPATMRQSLRRIALTGEASVFDAYQAMNAHTFPAEWNAPGGTREELVFFHPSAWQTAVWRPLSVRGNAPIFVPGRSFSAVLASPGSSASGGAGDAGGFALVCTEKALVVQNLSNARDRAEILTGMLVPRATASPEWPYLLLAPGEGYIGLTSLTLVPADEGLLAQ